MEKKFVLVVGSGVHRAVSLKEKPPGILASWDELLDELSTNQGLSSDARLSPPSSRWEEMLLRKIRSNSDSKSPLNRVANVEKEFRNKLAALLSNSVSNHEIDKSKASIFSASTVCDIVSLNFEASWAGVNAPKFFARVPKALKNKIEPKIGGRKILVNEAYRLYARMQGSDDINYWFPNGNVGRPSSLRLGYRDFGLQAQALKLAFDRFKSWEELVLPKRTAGEPRSQNDIFLLRRKYLNTRKSSYDSHPAALADHWVTAFMIFEPIFLGVGLSPDEQGLWWLLHQRARNLARVPSAHPPRILKICPPCIEAEYGRFLSGNPVLDPIWCRTWEEGWGLVEDILAGKRD